MQKTLGVKFYRSFFIELLTYLTFSDLLYKSNIFTDVLIIHMLSILNLRFFYLQV